MKRNRVANVNLFIVASLRFSLLLFDCMSKGLDMLLYFKVYFGFKTSQNDKNTSILQMLICLVKPLTNLTTFPHFRHIFNLDSIVIIALQ